VNWDFCNELFESQTKKWNNIIWKDIYRIKYYVSNYSNN
jgi:hypothetical protein